MFVLSSDEAKLLIKSINFYLKEKSIRDTNLQALCHALERNNFFLPINEQKIYMEDIPEIIQTYKKHKSSKKIKNLSKRYNQELLRWEKLKELG